jgi:hypothetical protein
MAFLGQSFDHMLNALKGYGPYMVDIEGTLSGNVNIGSVGNPPKAGMCVHVQTAAAVGNGAFVGNGPSEPAFEMGANLKMMPIFLWNSFDDFDVSNPGVPAGVALGGTTANPPAWVPVFPAGRLVGLVAKGAFELETTEFDTAQTYAPNDFLRAVTSNTDANAGKLTNQDASGGAGFATSAKAVWGDPTLTAWDSVVGRVSRGTYTSNYGKLVLSFWPESLPGTR